jgi:hypothetical protein
MCGADTAFVRIYGDTFFNVCRWGKFSLSDIALNGMSIREQVPKFVQDFENKLAIKATLTEQVHISFG